MLTILEATDNEREWAGHLLAKSEPWITLQAGIDQCLKACKDRDYLLFIARLNGQPCGALLLHPKGLASSPYLKSIVVEESFRGKEIGTRMIAFTEKYFRKNSRHLFLCVSSFNSKARRLYQRLGYRQVGEFKDYVIDGESELLLYKALR